MKAALTASARQLLDEYRQRLPLLKDAAAAARHLVQEILGPLGPMRHDITARAKTIESVREKLIRKQYRNPAAELTDTIGVRVVTYYACDVDEIVRKLSDEFDVDKRRSVDKRAALGVSEFGYRSVHLIVRLNSSRAKSPEYTCLARAYFEIQVRSILEDSWAEFDHEMVYKGGIKYPEEFLRRLAGLASMLEILDTEFTHIRDERRRIVEQLQHRYAQGMEKTRPLDSGRLIAFLSADRPNGRSWLHEPAGDASLPRGTERVCVDALRATGIHTASALAKVLREKAFRRALRLFASENRIDQGEVSHFAVVVLALATRDPRLLAQYFPDLLSDRLLYKMTHDRIRTPKGSR